MHFVFTPQLNLQVYIFGAKTQIQGLMHSEDYSCKLSCGVKTKCITRILSFPSFFLFFFLKTKMHHKNLFFFFFLSFLFFENENASQESFLSIKTQIQELMHSADSRDQLTSFALTNNSAHNSKSTNAAKRQILKGPMHSADSRDPFRSHSQTTHKSTSLAPKFEIMGFVAQILGIHFFCTHEQLRSQFRVNKCGQNPN